MGTREGHTARTARARALTGSDSGVGRNGEKKDERGAVVFVVAALDTHHATMEDRREEMSREVFSSPVSHLNLRFSVSICPKC